MAETESCSTSHHLYEPHKKKSKTQHAKATLFLEELAIVQEEIKKHGYESLSKQLETLRGKVNNVFEDKEEEVKKLHETIHMVYKFRFLVIFSELIQFLTFL